MPMGGKPTEVTDNQKHRQLPCRTFISTGTCPFRDRCDYLHDPRCLSKNAKSKTKRRKEEDIGTDSFFWPNLPLEHTRRRYDGQSMVVQQYVVPYPQLDQAYYHDASLYSLWNYFVEFCTKNNSGILENHTMGNIQTLHHNKFTGRRRLRVFVLMAHMDVMMSPSQQPSAGPASSMATSPSMTSSLSSYRHDFY